MKSKKLILPIFTLMVLMMAGLVSADSVTCTFDQTATTGGTRSTYIDGTSFNISATMSGDHDLGDNASTGVLTNSVTSDVYVYNVTQNAGASNFSQVNASVDTKLFGDDDTITFTWTVKNETQGTIATCTRTYIPDNGVPGCSFASGLDSSSKYPPTQLWSVACQNATSATIRFGSNGVLSMGESGDTCTFTGDKSRVPEGNYGTVVAIASDGLNTTSCELRSITIDLGVPVKEIAAILASQQSSKSAGASQQTAMNPMVLLLIAAGVLLYMRNKK